MQYSEIEKILSQKDTVLKEIIDSLTSPIQPFPSVDVYTDLMKSIVSQQLSVKVADIIWNRFINLYPNQNPIAEAVIITQHEDLRGVGLSNAKANYIKNVATFHLDKGINFEYLNNKTDQEVIDNLTEIKGVGKWTVQMVLMFSMDRPNVFPVDDLGIQTKMKKYYNLTDDKKKLKIEMTKIAEKWIPYRTLACKHLWNSTLK